MCAYQVLDEPEVSDLDAVADEQEVLRLDVEVLQTMYLGHVVERLGGIAEVAEQLFARNPLQGRLAALVEAVAQTAVGQFGDDDQLVVDHLDALEGKEKGVADFLDSAQGLTFLRGMTTIRIAKEDLDRLEEPARSGRLPDLAESADAELLDQTITRDRFALSFGCKRHGERGGYGAG